MPSTTTPCRRRIRTIRLSGPRAQRGVTLIELMVGITIGLLVVAVALAALMVSRSLTGTVSDASNIQQQAAYAMRVLGGQLRQTGSLYLNLNPSGAPAAAGNDLLAPVAFEVKAGTNPSDTYNYFDITTSTGQDALLNGTDGGASPDTLTAGFRRYQDPVFVDPSGGGAATATLTLNCTGGPADAGAPGANLLTQSVFRVANAPDTGVPQLLCSGNGNIQPIVDNVANFEVRYLVQNPAAPPGAVPPLIQSFKAGAVPDWRKVQGVEVCLVLYGSEPIGMPAGSKYTDCDGQVKDMTSTGANGVPGAQLNRMHLVFRNVFQLRSMGVM